MTAKLYSIDSEPEGDGIVSLLQEALEQAYAGELSSIAVVMVNKDGTTSQAHSFLPSFGLMLGSAHRLIHKLNIEMDE